MPDDRVTPLGEVAARLVGGDAGDSLREWVQEQTSGDLNTAVGAGLALGDAVNRHGRGAQAQQGPPVRVVERENDSGDLVGVRVVVDIPPQRAQLYTGPDGALLRTPDGEKAIPLPFTPADVEPLHEKGDTVSDWLLRRHDRPADVIDAEFEKLNDGDGEDE